MKNKPSNNDILFLVLTIVVIIAGVFFWSYDLESDPPLYFANLEQSLYTDPANLVYHARNAELFDNSDPLVDDRWVVFEKSLVSLTASILFGISKPSLVSSKIVGIILSFGALILFLAGLLKKYRGRVLFVFALLYIINITLFTHGRLSYLENGLLLFSALLFFVWSWWGKKTIGIVLSSVIIAFAVLMGKLFGILLFPALLAVIFFGDKENRFKNIVISTVSFVGSLYSLFIIVCVITGNPIHGWASTMVIILVLGGLLMLMLGILGKYLWRNLDESRKRSLYFIEISTSGEFEE